MAIKNTSIVIYYTAWDAANNAWKTGDVANHTMYTTKDGGATAAIDGTEAEVDATDIVLSIVNIVTEQGAVATIDSNVDAVLVDTGTTIPATLTTIEGKVDTVDTVADAIKAVTDALPNAGALSDIQTDLDSLTAQLSDAGCIDTGFDHKAAQKRILAALDGVVSAAGNVLTILNKAGAPETTQTIDANGNRSIA
jgi:hypothetical protein